MWCSRALNRTCGRLRAASRTPCIPIDTLVRPCVRGVAVCRMFLSVGRLPSTASEDKLPSFGGFAGTMQPSDFPETCMSDVRHSAFSDRPGPSSRPGVSGISRFPCEEFPHMHGVSDCAGPSHDSRLAPCLVSPSAQVNSVGVPNGFISQLNTRPVCTPVNASPAPSRVPAHDSGPVWFAKPSLYGSFIHYSPPVLPAHSPFTLHCL